MTSTLRPRLGNVPRCMSLAFVLAVLSAASIVEPTFARPTTGVTCESSTTVTWSATDHLAAVTLVWFGGDGSVTPENILRTTSLIPTRGTGAYTAPTPEGSVWVGLWFFDRQGDFVGRTSAYCV
jgi:hypothetical protein